MEREKAVPTTQKYLRNLDEAVQYLQECRDNGENVYLDFNGHRLYSCEVTIDSAYMEVVGMTKAEDTAIRAEYGKAKTPEEEKEIIAKWTAMRNRHKLEEKEAELAKEEAEANELTRQEAEIAKEKQEEK